MAADQGALMLDDISEQLSAAAAGLGVPGAAVALVRSDSEQVVTFGVTNVEHPLPVDAGALFQIGSTSKTLTATAVVRLVEDGRADLHEPVATYLPGARVAGGAASSISLYHLLTHTSGLQPDLWCDTGRGDDALERFVALLTDAEAYASPGALWSYSNAGFSVAGRVIETITGQTFEAAVTDLVLGPLGMEDSFFLADEMMTRRVAAGHTVDADGVARVARPWGMSRCLNPAGGLVSSASDQLRYLRFHLGDGVTPDGTRLLRQESMDMMRSALEPAGGGRAGANGLAWLIQTGRDTPVLAHGGSTNGQESGFVVVPEAQLGFTVLTNADTGAGLQAKLGKAILREVLGPTSHPSAEPAARDGLGEYVGVFADADDVAEVVTADGGVTLQLTPTPELLRFFPAVGSTPQMPMTIFSDDAVRVDAGPLRGARGEFVRDAAGDVRYLRLLGRARPRRVAS